MLVPALLLLTTQLVLAQVRSTTGGAGHNQLQDCTQQFPWIPSTVDHWYKDAQQARKVRPCDHREVEACDLSQTSPLTTEQGMEEIRKLMWGDYMPGAMV